MSVDIASLKAGYLSDAELVSLIEDRGMEPVRPSSPRVAVNS
jgi:hypothetical protein